MTEESFVCAQCGKVHEGLPTDLGFNQPDEIHELSYLSKYQRVRSNADLATLDDSRYFIRGVLPISFQGKDGYFGLGIWVEVSKESHDLYFAEFSNDASGIPKFEGKIANALPSYKDTLNRVVEVRLGDSKQRPMFWLPSNQSHPLAYDQANGLSVERHHEILEAYGTFDGDDA